jgi:hypothetical protein
MGKMVSHIEMTNYQKLGLVVGQVFAGLGGAIAGAFSFSILESVTSMISGTNSELYITLLCAWVGAYVGLFVGISIDGYKFLKKNDRQKYFLRHFLQGLFGLFIGLLGFYFTFMKFDTRGLSGAIVGLIGITLPLVGTILSFDYKLIVSIDKG